jgi:ABC-type maltose transport system permease subunit
MRSDLEEPASGDGLTAMGVFLFVALPLFVVGGLLFGRG